MSAASSKEYELGKVLSREKDSHTFVATRKDQPNDGQHFRVRRIFSAAADRMKANHAATIIDKLKVLSHDNLLPIVDSYVLSNEDTGSRDLCVVYEEQPFAHTLAHKLGENSFEPNLTGGMPALELSEVLDVFFGVLGGLAYLHQDETSTAHMDLRPETVLLSPGSCASDATAGAVTGEGSGKGLDVILTNYGLADIVAVNTLEFSAPEVHKGKSLLPNMLHKVDIWAVSKKHIMFYAA